AMTSKLRQGLPVSKQEAFLTVTQTDDDQAVQRLQRAPRQNKIWQLIKGQTQIRRSDLKALNLTPGALEPLIKKGLLAWQQSVPQAPSTSPLKHAGLDLNRHQQVAISNIKDQGTHLL
ncbi:MAG: hypothetical protein OSB45_06810, partial [Pseudomonadales bacterium]|nr:hypothetical protein [Pseudomonadales bacterium]